jgi:biopolymer transport protein ExbB/TolQ
VLLSLGLLNPLTAFQESDLIGKIIVVVLLCYSILTWSRMASKWSYFNRALADTRRFLYAFDRDASPLRVFLGHDKFTQSPLYAVYDKSCRRLVEELSPDGVRADSLFKIETGALGRRLSETQWEVVHKAIDRHVLDQALELQASMGPLANAATLAPFLGLLGTVWGVMEAFHAMALKGVPTLAEIAPGISSALLTTVMGLLVAIPAAWGHGILTERQRSLLVQLDNFAAEFGVEIKRHYHPHAQS